MTSDDSQQPDLSPVVSRVESLASTVFAAVGEVAELVEIAARRERRMDLAALAGIERLAEGHLVGHPHIWGLGFVADPAAFPDRGGLQWWYRSGRGAIRRLVVSLDKSALNFYDYVGAAWFDGARDGERHVTGPYIDAMGTNAHIVTFSQGVNAGGFLGVAGADVLVGTIQSVIQPLLQGIEDDVCLVDADGLVIATNRVELLANTVPPDGPDTLLALGIPEVAWRLTISTGG